MPLSLRTTLFAAAVLAVSLAPTVRAQVMPISWTVHIAPGAVHPGQAFTAVVRAQIPYSWHLYSTTQPLGGPMATTFGANAPAFVLHGAAAAREPDRAFDAIAEIKTETYSDSVTFRVPLVASKSGRQTLEITINYQSCTDRFCTPVQRQVVKVPVAVLPPAPITR